MLCYVLQSPNLFPIKLHNILEICYSIMAVGITFFKSKYILKCLHEFSIQCERATRQHVHCGIRYFWVENVCMFLVVCFQFSLNKLVELRKGGS